MTTQSTGSLISNNLIVKIQKLHLMEQVQSPLADSEKQDTFLRKNLCADPLEDKQMGKRKQRETRVVDKSVLI